MTTLEPTSTLLARAVEVATCPSCDARPGQLCRAPGSATTFDSALASHAKRALALVELEQRARRPRRNRKSTLRTFHEDVAGEVGCPRCGAREGESCVVMRDANRGTPALQPHIGRVQAWREPKPPKPTEARYWAAFPRSTALEVLSGRDWDGCTDWPESVAGPAPGQCA